MTPRLPDPVGGHDTALTLTARSSALTCSCGWGRAWTVDAAPPLPELERIAAMHRHPAMGPTT